MKKIILSAIAMALIISSCRKEDTPLPTESKTKSSRSAEAIDPSFHLGGKGRSSQSAEAIHPSFHLGGR